MKDAELTPLQQQPRPNLRFLVSLTCISAIGGFLFGYDTGVIGGANVYIYDDLGHDTPIVKSTVVSIAILGAIFGAGSGGWTADRFGRKFTILISDVVFMIGALVMALAVDIVMLIFGRFIVGFGIGMASMIVPIYLAEAAPPNHRGAVVGTNIFFVTSGQLIAYCVCLACGSNWRLMLGISGVPAAIQLVGMLALEESPRWLFKCHRDTEAIQVLLRIRLHEDNRLVDYIQDEIDEILDEISKERDLPGLELLKHLFTTSRRASRVGIGLQVLQQLVGINTVMYFGPQLMQMVGFNGSKEIAIITSIPLAGVNVLGTVVAMLWVDNLGRRSVLLWTTPVIILCLTTLSVAFYFILYTAVSAFTYIALTMILLYVFVFATGLGSIPWTVNSEIYPLYLRSTANSVSSMSNWASNFIVSMTFLTLTSTNIGLILAWDILAGFAVGAWFWVYYLLPETKGLALEEVMELFRSEYPEEVRPGFVLQLSDKSS
jgi:SP family myo-inositol transporter-like MFS transporter 13